MADTKKSKKSVVFGTVQPIFMAAAFFALIVWRFWALALYRAWTEAESGPAEPTS